MSLPQRETTLRNMLGLVYPDPTGIVRHDQYTLLDLVYVQSLDGAITGNLKFSATYRGKGDFKPSINGQIKTEPKRA